jgi:hypothetical protein
MFIEEFRKSRMVYSTKQFEDRFEISLQTNNKKVSVYDNNSYIIHTGSKYLVERRRKSTVIADSLEEAERLLYQEYLKH